MKGSLLGSLGLLELVSLSESSLPNRFLVDGHFGAVSLSWVTDLFENEFVMEDGIEVMRRFKVSFCRYVRRER